MKLLVHIKYFLFPMLIVVTHDTAKAQHGNAERYVPERVITSDVVRKANDSILFSYDWANKITEISSSIAGIKESRRRFQVVLKYDENGFLRSLVETPLAPSDDIKQEYTFGYHGDGILTKIQYASDNSSFEVTVRYSAPTNTYSFENEGQWHNYTFVDGVLASYRIKGYEVLSVHISEEEGATRYVRSDLPFQIVSQYLGSLPPLISWALADKQVQLLVYNDQHLFVHTKRDEFGRIAQIDFESEELGVFRTATIEYLTVK